MAGEVGSHARRAGSDGRETRWWGTRRVKLAFQESGTWGTIATVAVRAVQRLMSHPLPSPRANEPDVEDALLDGIAGLVVVLDAGGRIVRFNRACEEATGISRVAAVGRTFAAVFPGSGGRETSCVDAGGATRVIEWTRRAVADVDGDRGAGFVVCTGTDVTERQVAEQAGRDRESLYRNIVETAHEGVWVIDVEGRTLYANRRIAEILGYGPEEMAKVNIYDCMDPSQHAGFRDRLERRKRGETQTLEWCCRRKDGSPLWTMVTSSPLFDDRDGRLVGLLGMVTDLSDQRRIAEALRESEERFRLAVEASPDTMFFQDTELRLTWISKVMPPRTAEDLIGRTDAEILPPADAERLGVIKRRVMETGVPERTEFEHATADGRRMIVDVMFVRRADADGRTLGLAGYARDVTDRRVVERALAELNQSLEERVAERTDSLRFSEERFRLMAEQAPVSIQILAPDGRTLRVNAAFRRLFGVGAEELAGYNILADPQLEAAGVMGQIRRAFVGETVVVPPVKYVPDRGPLAGQERWAQALAYPLLGEDGRVREVVIVHEDVTERRQAEDQLRDRERHYREMAERNKLLMQEVEHRVGNNLAGLLGLVTMMRGRVRTVDAFATSIEARLRAMTRVHRSLAGSGWRSVGLGDLVRGVLRGMGQIAQCVAAERVDGPDVSVPPKLALPLTLILAEWHTNSCKYGAHSVPGGELHVTWTLSEGRAAGTWRIWLTWCEQGGPPVRQPVIGSVGSDLVHAFATRELGGGCTMTFPPTGAHHAIEFVVPR